MASNLGGESAAPDERGQELVAEPLVRKHKLRLTIEVPSLYADDLHEMAGYMSEPDEPTEEDYRFLVLEEWMREDVGLTIVTLPGEKCMNHEFEVVALQGRIVGVSLDPPASSTPSDQGERP